MAVPFDPQRLIVTGPPSLAVEGVLQSKQRRRPIQHSATGSLVYARGWRRRPLAALVWVDRQGREQTCPAAAGPMGSRDSLPMVSAWLWACEGNIWVDDLARNTLTKLTVQGRRRHAVWTPDGKRIAFTSIKEGR